MNVEELDGFAGYKYHRPTEHAVVGVAPHQASNELVVWSLLSYPAIIIHRG